MATETTGFDTTAYIQHHLQNLKFGKLPAGYERHGDDGRCGDTADGCIVAAAGRYLR